MNKKTTHYITSDKTVPTIMILTSLLNILDKKKTDLNFQNLFFFYNTPFQFCSLKTSSLV